jgi:tRNA pseudouridine65 synthase
MSFTLLYQDSDIVAIDKPAGFHVHQPEFPRRRVPKSQTCLPILRDQLKQYVYPVHRLDVATSGVLLFALNSAMAGQLCGLFAKNAIEKRYLAVVRGYTPLEGEIDLPLKSDSSGEMVAAHTSYRRIATTELPFAVGKRHPQARYSLVEAWPHTGRFHQIRRHLARISHPIVGDAIHGDSHHNRFFREELGFRGLLLRAAELEFAHPISGESILIMSRASENWLRMLKKSGLAEL